MKICHEIVDWITTTLTEPATEWVQTQREECEFRWTWNLLKLVQSLFCWLVFSLVELIIWVTSTIVTSVVSIVCEVVVLVFVVAVLGVPFILMYLFGPDQIDSSLECSNERIIANTYGPSTDPVLTGTIMRKVSKFPADFPQWTAAGIGNLQQKHTYLSVVADPGVGARNTLAFVSLGQAPSQMTGANASTGLPDGWASSCSNSTGECPNIDLDGRSILAKLEKYVAPKKSSWIAISGQPKFDHNDSPGRKERTVTAYTNWILSQADYSTKQIILIGTSRAGCLMPRVAQQITADIKNPFTVYVVAMDAVCADYQSELGVESWRLIHNFRDTAPFVSYKANFTDIEAQFPARNKLRMLNLPGGNAAGPNFLMVRAFAAHPSRPKPFLAETGCNIYSDWFDQNWVYWRGMTHIAQGNSYDHPDETIDLIITWLAAKTQGNPLNLGPI